MADEAKTLILSLEFDTEEGLKRAANFRSAIDADKEALAELNKVIKKGGELNAEQLLNREKLEQSIKKNTQSRQTELRAIESYIKATKGAIDENGKYTGSINNLRGNLSFLTAKWNDLSKAERENKDIGGVMQKEIKQLSDQLKEMEGSVGDNRRSVGGYLDAIRQAPGAMGKFKAGVDGISTAVKANPIGLLVTALAFLPKLLNSSGEGADFFAKTMSIVNAIVQEGLKRLVALGGAAVKLFSGDFKGAFTDGKAALSGFTDSVTSAVRAGGELADRLDKLENAESRFAAASSKTKLEIDRLVAQAKGRAVSEKEREILLERALKMEIGLNTQALKLAKERLALIKEENRINTGDEDEEIKRVNEQQERINDLLGQSLVFQERIQARRDANADAAAEREKKRKEDALKLAEEAFDKDRERLRKEAESLDKHYKETQERLKKETEEHDKARESYVNTANEKMKAAAAFTKEQITLAKLEQEEEKRLSELKIKQKEDEFKAVSAITSGLSNLVGVLAAQNSEFAEFQKALTIVQIAMSSAEAVSKGIASVAGIPFPGNLIALAPTIGTLLSNMAQATALVQQPIPKAPASRKFADGGIVSGASHSEGGVKGTGSFAGIEVEGGEAILTKRATAMFAPILSALNVAGGGKPLAPTRYAALGGFIPGAGSGSIGGSVIDYDKLANKMMQAFEKAPAPIVSVTALNQETLKRDNRQKAVTLGR